MTDYSNPLFVKLALTYIAMVCLAGLGVIQAAAAYNSLKGLLFLRSKTGSYALAVALTGPPLFLFFTWNEHWAISIIQGFEQTVLFVLGVAAALFGTMLFASLGGRSCGTDQDEKTCLPALRHNTWLQVVGRRVKRRDDGLG